MISYIYFIYIGRISQKQRRKRISRIGTSTRSAGSSHQQDQSVNRVGVSVGSVYQHDHHISRSWVSEGSAHQITKKCRPSPHLFTFPVVEVENYGGGRTNTDIQIFHRVLQMTKKTTLQFYHIKINRCQVLSMYITTAL